MRIIQVLMSELELNHDCIGDFRNLALSCRPGQLQMTVATGWTPDGYDKRVLKLIRAFLNAGVMEDGLVRPVGQGTGAKGVRFRPS